MVVQIDCLFPTAYCYVHTFAVFFSPAVPPSVTCYMYIFAVFPPLPYLSDTCYPCRVAGRSSRRGLARRSGWWTCWTRACAVRRPSWRRRSETRSVGGFCISANDFKYYCCTRLFNALCLSVRLEFCYRLFTHFPLSRRSQSFTRCSFPMAVQY